MRTHSLVVPLVVVVLVAGLALAGEASACVCVDQPLSERLDDADDAVVGRIVDQSDGAQSRLLTVEVDQRVKGDVPKTIRVRSPLRTSCDLVATGDEAIGLLLQRQNGIWEANLCSVVDPGELVAAGGEPRGGPIKVALGVAILALVVGWALVRLRRGSRPHLPGAP